MISKSVSKILQEVCNTRKHLLEITFANFQLFGAASFELNRGVLAMSRGEESSLFQCALLGVSPILAPQGRCYDQLPVIAQTPEGPEKFFLSPRSRILIKNPSPVKCSEHFPVKFRVNERLSICQSNPKRGIHTCPSTSVINPAEGLMQGKYETLHEQESKTGKVTLVSDIIQIISDFVTMTNYRASVDASVVSNRRVCEGQLFCTQAFMTNMALRRESSRQSLSLYEWLTNSPLYEFLDLVALIWCSYVILSGTLSYLLRLKSTCTARAQRFTCRQIFFSFFSDLDVALNPLNLSKIDTKIKIQESQAKLISLQNMIYPLIDTQEDLVQRLYTAEETIKEMLDQQTGDENGIRTHAGYTTMFKNDGEDGAGKGTISGFKTKSKGLYGSKSQGFRLKQFSLNRRKRKVHFEMPVAPPRGRRMVEEVEIEDDVLDEEQSSLLPPPPESMLRDNPEYTENLQLNRERIKEEMKAISTSRPRLKASSLRNVRPQLTLIPANLKHKTKKTQPTSSSSNIRVTAEHHSNDQHNTWEEDRG